MNHRRSRLVGTLDVAGSLRIETTPQNLGDRRREPTLAYDTLSYPLSMEGEGLQPTF
jgi:hypothetical protein